MKNYSAIKLLNMAMKGEHIANCPKSSKIQIGHVCKCWQYEAKRWSDRLKKIAAKRIRSYKLHIIKDAAANSIFCGAKNPQNTTTDPKLSTCISCIKATANPTKIKKSLPGNPFIFVVPQND